MAAWAGGALIGRELENGTAQLAWTQSVSPTRWLAAKLAVPALLLVAGGTVFVLVFRWAWAANRDLMGDDWTFNDVFAARGPALVAYGLCALAVGALAGVVLRRSLPALGVSCGVMYLINHSLEKHREDLWPTVRLARFRGVGVRPEHLSSRTAPRFHPAVPLLAAASRGDRHRPRRAPRSPPERLLVLRRCAAERPPHRTAHGA